MRPVLVGGDDLPAGRSRGARTPGKAFDERDFSLAQMGVASWFKPSSEPRFQALKKVSIPQ
jgi:hypothetical protein